ncbi:MAG TPA: acyltransferase [Verrucomicrobiae bacterium]|nr:acyltransferase [Verrucomicrobiae bacterium]
MLTFLPAPVVGVIMALVLSVHTVLWASLVYVGILLKLVSPPGPARDASSRLTAWLAQRWAILNTVWVRWFLRVEWHIRIDADLSPHGQYLVCANHQSWNDIFVLMRTFGSKAPFFKFFLKQELIWVPVLGLCWWGLDYPFMKRYTQEQVARNPALKGKDLETTRRACERYKNQPVLILNFLEGTRFTTAKHAQQRSPYARLLKPKSGGFAFTLSALGERLSSLLDVTIVYPGGAQGFWEFLCGKVRKVVVDVRQLRIPADLFTGSYENDPVFRQRFQDWIGELWFDKDRRVAELLAQHALEGSK